MRAKLWLFVFRARVRWSMFRELWALRQTGRSVLIGEYLFNPGALRNRYAKEARFQHELCRRWQSDE